MLAKGVLSSITIKMSGIVPDDGEKIFIIIYGGRDGVTFNKLRHIRFCEKVIKGKTAVSEKNVTLTAAEDRQHCLRVHYTLQAWMGHGLTATEWGWTDTNGKLVPVTSEEEPALKDLLSIIR